jgi:hypothetical protein
MGVEKEGLLAKIIKFISSYTPPLRVQLYKGN